MNIQPNPENRQQQLIMLYQKYLFGEITQGQLLSYLRKTVLKLSQTQYAELVGISRRTLTNIEQDQGRQTQQTLDQAFKPLGLKTGLVLTHPHVLKKLFKNTLNHPN